MKKANKRERLDGELRQSTICFTHVPRSNAHKGVLTKGQLPKERRSGKMKFDGKQHKYGTGHSCPCSASNKPRLDTMLVLGSGERSEQQD